MKKCSYCGMEYPDNATVCERDGQPLVDLSAPSSSSPKPRAGKEYRRLPGRGTQSEGSSLFSASRTMITMWMAQDHLLLVSRTGYTETYKRFYFRDIQAIIIRKTIASLIGNIVLIILALGFFLCMAAVSDAVGRVVMGLIGGFFAFLVLVSFWLGSTCKTQIKTAVQTEQLAAWSRMRAARKGMALIRPRLLEAQGEFSLEELKARLEEQILRQTQPSAPETS